jgi:AraC-like DNA-binding protein
LRAARLQAVLQEIKTSFTNPEFSPHSVAQRLGLSPRYVQDLLQDTAFSFTERVVELRLQQARAMLVDRRHDRFKIVDIAGAAGFNEISHFNRTFRRRFGASPSELRARPRS